MYVFKARAFKMVLIAFIVVCTCSCPSVPTDADAVAGNSRAVGQLEATVTSLDRTVANSRERIGEVITTSRGLEDGIERLKYLFECYEREVIELQREIDSIRRAIKIPKDVDTERVDTDTISRSSEADGSHTPP